MPGVVTHWVSIRGGCAAGVNRCRVNDKRCTERGDNASIVNFAGPQNDEQARSGGDSSLDEAGQNRVSNVRRYQLNPARYSKF